MVEETPQARETRHWTEYLSAFGAVAAVIIAAVAAAFSAFQASISNRQADIAADTERRQLRAYVSVLIDRSSLDKVGDDGQLIVLEATNLGQTPAYGVHVEVALTASYPPASKDMRPTTPNFVLGGGGQKFPMHISKEHFSRQQIADWLQNNGSEVFLSGTVAYRDIFRAQHMSRFCLDYSIDQESKNYHLQPCAVGNDED